MSDQPPNAPVVLVILDGWGLEPLSPGNAIELAATPAFDHLWATYPRTSLKTSGHDVGLPSGQMGNSEVGHLNLGAGFIVYQSITRIDVAIDNGEFFTNRVLESAIRRAADQGVQLHLLGLVSDGGVHSHINHLDALLDLARREGARDVAVHAILDGRDTSPNGGIDYLRQTQAMIESHGRGRIASVIGRYFAMDRDRRWERVDKAYRLLVHGQGEPVDDPIAAVQRHYEAGTTDEFMVPLSVGGDDEAATIAPRDVVIFFNFRSDRGRELTQALIGPPLDGVDLFDDRPADLTFVTMTDYADFLPSLVAFPVIDVVFPIARVLSAAGLKQFHAAETEKYPHVTYFFNGGREEPFPGEDRSLTPSPKVATYDLQPEMSAEGIATATVAAIESGEYAFVIVNFANCDMVGHTGVLGAAITATEAVDRQLSRIVDATVGQGGTVLVTADHGNAERMFVPGTNEPMTAHTTNPVPFIVVAPDSAPHHSRPLRTGGRLADVTPTVLDLLHITLPEEMTGVSLLRSTDEKVVRGAVPSDDGNGTH